MSSKEDNTHKSGESPVKDEEVLPTEKVKSWLDALKTGIEEDDADSDHVSTGGDEDAKTDTVTSNNGSWNNGDRPFKGAMDTYMTLMRKKLRGCIGCLNARSDFTYANVKVDPNAELIVTLDDGSVRKYKFHSVHYGPLRIKHGTAGTQRHWRSRDNIYDRLGVYPPFRVLQVEMLNSGYYLMDVSDPSKSKRMIINLYRNKPAFPLKLWHGYGVIPTLGAVTPQVPPMVPSASGGFPAFHPGFAGFVPGTHPGFPRGAIQPMVFHPMFRGVPVFPPRGFPMGAPPVPVPTVHGPPQSATPEDEGASEPLDMTGLEPPKLVRQYQVGTDGNPIKNLYKALEQEGEKILSASGSPDTPKDDTEEFDSGEDDD